jgi:hypothetical protein
MYCIPRDRFSFLCDRASKISLLRSTYIFEHLLSQANDVDNPYKTRLDCERLENSLHVEPSRMSEMLTFCWPVESVDLLF